MQEKVGTYHSRMIERYMAFLAKCEKPQILDMGPVSGDNITFFLGYDAKLRVWDTVHTLGEVKGDDVLEGCEFGQESFDGIHLWDIPDHLENRLLLPLIEKCRSLLKPHGVLLVLANNLVNPQPFPHYLLIGEQGFVTLQRLTQVHLPYFYRSNREIESIYRPLATMASYVCMNGFREFLFRSAHEHPLV